MRYFQPSRKNSKWFNANDFADFSFPKIVNFMVLLFFLEENGFCLARLFVGVLVSELVCKLVGAFVGTLVSCEYSLLGFSVCLLVFWSVSWFVSWLVRLLVRLFVVRVHWFLGLFVGFLWDELVGYVLFNVEAFQNFFFDSTRSEGSVSNLR